MNRIILIGNGFDLAHNLKTQYSDFIYWAWRNIESEIQDLNNRVKTYNKPMTVHYLMKDNNNLIQIKVMENYNDNNVIYIKDNEITLNTLPSNTKPIEYIRWIQEQDFIYQNIFFETISKDCAEQGWSDIEQVYYDELLKVKDNQHNVQKLNEDFEEIKKLLITYLKKIETPNKIENIENEIKSPILPIQISQSNFHKYQMDLESIYKMNRNSMDIDKLFNYDPFNKHHKAKQKSTPIQKTLAYFEEKGDYQESDVFSDLFAPENIYILSFNYTNSEKKYTDSIYNQTKQNYIEFSTLHIHGELENENNPIIFGYGDEYDDNYNELEKSKVKGILDNIKSMKYLETSNYKKFENIINSGLYQVVIMGHSCGLTDKTLLKTLFEHENCASIKPYYYKNKETGWDNYNEIIQAISRCFTDKSKLRSVVVNKEYCKPLPQA